MHFASGHVVETVARRRIGEESDAMDAMERIDRRRKASGLAGKTGKNVIASAGSDDFAELLRGIARWPAALENHVHARRLEPFDPVGEFRRLIEKWRTAGPTNKGDRPSNLARMCERGTAIDEHVGRRRDC